MDDVERLVRANGGAVAGWQTTLNGHTKLLNAIWDDVVNQRREMRDGFAKVDANFARVEDKFELLRRGQDQILSLLTSPAACLPARRPENTQSASDSPLT